MTGSIGELIRDWRSQRSLSLGALGHKAGVHKTTLSRWERQERQPRVSELEAVLDALQATNAQRRQALAALEAPRAVVRLRQLADSGASPVPPTGGDLLRAMRLRQGWTLEQVGAQTGIAFSVLARYERGEQWPDDTRLHLLCSALRAYPEEVAALTCRGPWLLEPLESTLHAEPETWYGRMLTAWLCPDALQDLHFLSIEAYLWRLATRQSFALPLLQCAYAYHARALMQTPRYAQTLPYAQYSLDLTRQGYTYREEWPMSVIAIATIQARKGRPQDGRHAAERLRSYLPEVRDIATQAWMLAEMGLHYMQAGDYLTAETLAQEAWQVSRGANDPQETWLRQRDQAQIRMLQGRYGAALDLLEASSELMQLNQEFRVRHLLLGAQCLLGEGKYTAAQDLYTQAVQNIEMYRFSSLNEMAQAVQRRIESKA